MEDMLILTEHHKRMRGRPPKYSTEQKEALLKAAIDEPKVRGWKAKLAKASGMELFSAYNILAGL